MKICLKLRRVAKRAAHMYRLSYEGCRSVPALPRARLTHLARCNDAPEEYAE